MMDVQRTGDWQRLMEALGTGRGVVVTTKSEAIGPAVVARLSDDMVTLRWPDHGDRAWRTLDRYDVLSVEWAPPVEGKPR